MSISIANGFRSKGIIAIVASLVALSTSGVQLYQESIGTHTVVIASSPSAAHQLAASTRRRGATAKKAPLLLERGSS